MMIKAVCLCCLVTVLVIFYMLHYVYTVQPSKDPHLLQSALKVKKHPAEKKKKKKHVHTKDLLLYNAVPKSGSITLSLIMQNLSQKLGYKFVLLLGFPAEEYGQSGVSPHYTGDLQARFARYVTSQPRPFALRQHFHFVDLEEVLGNGSTINPAYISFIRDPVERFVSRFHFVRRLPDFFYDQFLPEVEPQSIMGVSKEQWTNKSLRQCVRSNDRECIPQPGDHVDFSIPYFCGQQPHCLEYRNRQALADALTNIDKHYEVVGILEELRLSYRVLEAKLPRFFKKLTRHLKVHANGGQHKEELDPKEKRKLRRTMADEYEIYRFAKRRLHRQGKALGIIR